MAKYYIKYNGEVMSAAAFCLRTGIPYETMRQYLLRKPDNSAVSQPDNANDKQSEKYNGYSLQELTDLYRYYAGADDELQMLSDFANVSKEKAEKLLTIIKERRSKIYEVPQSGLRQAP